MIRSLYLSAKKPLRTNLSIEEVSMALEDTTGLLWVDFEGEPALDVDSVLRNVFEFHPLTIDDTLVETHSPKLDDWDNYLYLVLRGINFDPNADDEPMTTQELDIFIGPNYLVTYHAAAIPAVQRVWATYCQKMVRPKRDIGYLLYRLADELVANYLVVVEELDDILDTIEDQLFERPTAEVLEDIFELKRALLILRRTLLPQHEVLKKLAREKYTVIKQKDRAFFSDVADHLGRLQNTVESLRELVSSALNTYLSVVNNQMNDVMKTLTIVTTVFMPLSFIVGFFGMNFFQAISPPDLWTSRAVFIVTLMTMTLLPLGMFLWVRRQGWM